MFLFTYLQTYIYIIISLYSFFYKYFYKIHKNIFYIFLDIITTSKFMHSSKYLWISQKYLNKIAYNNIFISLNTFSFFIIYIKNIDEII